MDGGNCNCSNLNTQTFPYYHRRCKKKEMLLETNIDSLPDEILFDILVGFPARDIYNGTRLVCRKWYQLINSPSFIYQNLHHSTSGLLIHMCDLKSPTTFVAMRKGRIEISKLSYKGTEFVQSSCNGLILLRGRTSYEKFYITNPLTKRHFPLPTDFLIWGIRYAAIAYAPTSMAYKVVYLFRDINSKSTGCAMLTVGVDKSWRRIVISHHLSEITEGLSVVKPLTIGGFVIWGQKSKVLMCNVETEIITQVQVPQYRGERLEYYYLSAGRYLSLLIECTKFSWEVWEMKPETGEWSKLPNINFEARLFKQLRLKRYNSLDVRPTPVGWLKFQEVLVFCVSARLVERLCIAYNIHTQEIESFELDSGWSNFFVHRNTLVSLNGC